MPRKDHRKRQPTEEKDLPRFGLAEDLVNQLPAAEMLGVSSVAAGHDTAPTVSQEQDPPISPLEALLAGFIPSAHGDEPGHNGSQIGPVIPAVNKHVPPQGQGIVDVRPGSGGLVHRFPFENDASQIAAQVPANEFGAGSLHPHEGVSTSPELRRTPLENAVIFLEETPTSTTPLEELIADSGRVNTPSDVLDQLPSSFYGPDFEENLGLSEEGPPVLSDEQERIDNIVADQPAIFNIEDNPDADGSAPWYAKAKIEMPYDDHLRNIEQGVYYDAHGSASEKISQIDDLIEEISKSKGVDPDLVRAIIYVEVSHGGFYGNYAEMLGVAKSKLPMNIKPGVWGGLVEKGADFSEIAVNLEAGIELIRRIRDRIPNATPAKIASIYNFTGREKVSDYGARVADVMKHRDWELTFEEVIRRQAK